MKNLLLICITCFMFIFLACNNPSTDTGNSDSMENNRSADSITPAPSDTLYPKTDTSALNRQPADSTTHKK